MHMIIALAIVVGLVLVVALIIKLVANDGGYCSKQQQALIGTVQEPVADESVYECPETDRYGQPMYTLSRSSSSPSIH